MPERKTIKCPFCNVGEIVSLYTPRTFVTRYSHASSNRKAMNYFVEERNEIITDKCPNCGKSKKEIENALIHGKELPNSEVLRRLKEAGLDPTKLK
jgi:transcription elongation factor Elf1